LQSLSNKRNLHTYGQYVARLRLRDTLVKGKLSMNESTIWWLIAGSLVGIELMTGTFYLLMLAIGASAGAIAAHAQFSFSSQLITG